MHHAEGRQRGAGVLPLSLVLIPAILASMAAISSGGAPSLEMSPREASTAFCNTSSSESCSNWREVSEEGKALDAAEIFQFAAMVSVGRHSTPGGWLWFFGCWVLSRDVEAGGLQQAVLRWRYKTTVWNESSRTEVVRLDVSVGALMSRERMARRQTEDFSHTRSTTQRNQSWKEGSSRSCSCSCRQS